MAASLSDFITIPVAYASSRHFIYAQSRKPCRKNPSNPADVLPEGRTLFLVNIPPDATERELVRLFQPCGNVERVSFGSSATSDALLESASDDGDDNDDDRGDDANATQIHIQVDPNERPRKKQKLHTSKPQPPEIIPLPLSAPLLRTLHKTGSCANVIFLDPSSLEKALRVFSSQPQQPWAWPSSEEPRGISHYRAKYDAERPPLDVIKAHADSYMERFEFDLAKSKHKQDSKYRKGEAIVDEEGFTLVARGGAYGRTLGGGVGVASRRFMLTGASAKNGNGNGSRSRKQKEKKENGTFYAFQKAERQRQDILNMRRNFEMDKARVEKMKESRRFKPY